MSDILFTVGDRCFVWDSDKEDRNVRERKIEFRSGVQALMDPNLVHLGNASKDDDPEYREKIIGMDWSTRLLIVVFHELEPDGTVRIISARKAEPHEWSDYYA
jgi:uncharacterized DUF497 family protein